MTSQHNNRCTDKDLTHRHSPLLRDMGERPKARGAGGKATLCMIAAILVAACATAPTNTNVTNTPALESALTQEAFLKDWDAWRAHRDKSLRSPDGWLTLIGLFWLDDGLQRLGSASDNEIILESASAPALLGQLDVQRTDAVGAVPSVRFVAAPGQSVRLADAAADAQAITEIVLATDATGAPTVLRHNTITMHVIERADRLALRVKDSDSHVLKDFGGATYFPADMKWRVKATLKKHPAPQMLNVPTAIGTVEPQASPGILEFEIDGQPVQLHPVGEPGDESLFVIFADATSGQETYGAGRFLSADRTPEGDFVLDFNRAYNPPCAFTPYATCPRPPAENRLKVAILAGEKAP
jgi:uncharacterized protein (DUF1684 family)